MVAVSPAAEPSPSSSRAAVLSGYDAAFAHTAARVLHPLCRLWFRYRFRDLDRVPACGPVLLVANHSALGSAELACMISAWHTERHERPARGLQMDMFLKWPGLGPFFRKCGAIPASPANGRAALEAGHAVLVFPGGDIDTCRPFYEPRAVHFGSRRGYVRLAIETGATVVPVATIGSHYTWMFAPGGGWLARALGLKRRFRIERFPLPLNVFAILALLALTLGGVIPVWLDALLVLAALLPTPARITSRYLPPIDVAARTAHLAHDPAARLEEGHRIVHGTLADAVRTMRHDDV